jgi:hypothetical protein
VPHLGTIIAEFGFQKVLIHSKGVKGRGFLARHARKNRASTHVGGGIESLANSYK